MFSWVTSIFTSLFGVVRDTIEDSQARRRRRRALRHDVDRFLRDIQTELETHPHIEGRVLVREALADVIGRRRDSLKDMMRLWNF